MSPEAGDGWSTPWSARRAGPRADLCATDEVRDEVCGAIRQLLLDALEGERPQRLSLEIGAGKRQSAELVRSAGEALIFMDLAQSMVLKRMVGLLRDRRPYHEMAALLSACSGLAVAAEDPALASALLTAQVEPSMEHYLHDDATLRHYAVDFSNRHPRLLFERAPLLVDGYILAHEAAHFLLAGPGDDVTVRLKALAKQAFDFALDQVCYERRPDFEAIATYWGKVSFDAEALSEKRRTLALRRIYYETHSEALIEEIACDAHGVMAVWGLMRQELTEARGQADSMAGYMRFVETYYLLFVLINLHQAMIGRAKSAAATGADSDRPADIADMHLREVAIVFIMADLALTVTPEGARGHQAFWKMLERLSELIQAEKHCLDFLVVVPVTRAVREQRVAALEARGGSCSGRTAADGRFDLSEIFGRERTSLTFREPAVRRLSFWTPSRGGGVK